jgi:Group II intron, maturase-specific domain
LLGGIAATPETGVHASGLAKLGYTFRYDRDQFGRGQCYLNVIPAKQAIKRERAKLHELTNHRRCYVPLPSLIAQLNRHLRGWQTYYSFGYPSEARKQIRKAFVRPSHATRESTQPATLSEAAGCELLRLLQTPGLAISLRVAQLLDKLAARVYVRAGCGKSARPVRGGESESCGYIAFSPTLLGFRGSCSRSVPKASCPLGPFAIQQPLRKTLGKFAARRGNCNRY